MLESLRFRRSAGELQLCFWRESCNCAFGLLFGGAMAKSVRNSFINCFHALDELCAEHALEIDCNTEKKKPCTLERNCAVAVNVHSEDGGEWRCAEQRVETDKGFRSCRRMKRYTT